MFGFSLTSGILWVTAEGDVAVLRRGAPCAQYSTYAADGESSVRSTFATRELVVDIVVVLSNMEGLLVELQADVSTIKAKRMSKVNL